MQNNARIRKFIRHPADVPIRVLLDGAPAGVEEHPCDKLSNVGLGGLSFFSPQVLPIGQRVSVAFPLLNDHCSLNALVVWNQPRKRGFEVGLQFDDPDQLFCLRMIEQVCHIEHYRREVEALEGRELSSEDAAREWISRYANDFPAVEL